jgi:hypothetical protein
MTYKNNELIKRFMRGRNSGKACNMDIRELVIDDEVKGTILVDYDWAILAFRSKKGNITVFKSWKGYSHTTSTHLNKVLNMAINKGDRIETEKRPVLRNRRYGDPYIKPCNWDNFPYHSELEERVVEVAR